MSIPLKNTIYDKIKQAGSLTDSELSKALSKDDIIVPEAKFSKLLLDLEIIGLIKVSWLTKDSKRIEVVKEKNYKIDDATQEDNGNKYNVKDDDYSDDGIRIVSEKDYEASFPGTMSKQ